MYFDNNFEPFIAHDDEEEHEFLESLKLNLDKYSTDPLASNSKKVKQRNNDFIDYQLDPLQQTNIIEFSRSDSSSSIDNISNDIKPIQQSKVVDISNTMLISPKRHKSTEGKLDKSRKSSPRYSSLGVQKVKSGSDIPLSFPLIQPNPAGYHRRNSQADLLDSSHNQQLLNQYNNSSLLNRPNTVYNVQNSIPNMNYHGSPNMAYQQQQQSAQQQIHMQTPVQYNSSPQTQSLISFDQSYSQANSSSDSYRMNNPYINVSQSFPSNQRQPYPNNTLGPYPLLNQNYTNSNINLNYGIPDNHMYNQQLPPLSSIGLPMNTPQYIPRYSTSDSLDSYDQNNNSDVRQSYDNMIYPIRPSNIITNLSIYSNEMSDRLSPINFGSISLQNQPQDNNSYNSQSNDDKNFYDFTDDSQNIDHDDLSKMIVNSNQLLVSINRAKKSNNSSVVTSNQSSRCPSASTSPASNRKDKSLLVISTKFLAHFGDNGTYYTNNAVNDDLPKANDYVRIDIAADQLGVHVRRVYEVLSVFESLSLVETGRGKFKWIGFNNLLATLYGIQANGLRKYCFKDNCNFTPVTNSVKGNNFINSNAILNNEMTFAHDMLSNDTHHNFNSSNLANTNYYEDLMIDQSFDPSMLIFTADSITESTVTNMIHTSSQDSMITSSDHTGTHYRSVSHSYDDDDAVHIDNRFEVPDGLAVLSDATRFISQDNNNLIVDSMNKIPNSIYKAWTEDSAVKISNDTFENHKNIVTTISKNSSSDIKSMKSEPAVTSLSSKRNRSDEQSLNALCKQFLELFLVGYDIFNINFAIQMISKSSAEIVNLYHEQKLNNQINIPLIRRDCFVINQINDDNILMAINTSEALRSLSNDSILVKPTAKNISMIGGIEKMTTKTRRLYDIANVLCSLNILKKYTKSEYEGPEFINTNTSSRCFMWSYPYKPKDIYNLFNRK